ncbi:hypothetical protein VN97_g6679 [Penicillium thymicola]|uniref:Uncharacterized protein n=1 Tax=Penicillium thymicola TaxID=293382 RepID=A0AAI9TFY4_PENTH|nr:hypothetical protein VN97_g6679 [Penicillium thymicola]
MSARTQAKSKLISRGPLDPNEARWARMIKTTYTDPLGVERTWESAERTVRLIPPCYVLIPLCCTLLVYARGICINTRRRYPSDTPAGLPRGPPT